MPMSLIQQYSAMIPSLNEPELSNLNKWKDIEGVLVMLLKTNSYHQGWLDVFMDGHQDMGAARAVLENLFINPDLVEIKHVYGYRSCLYSIPFNEWNINSIEVVANPFDQASAANCISSETSQFYIDTNSYVFLPVEPLKATEKQAIPITAIYVKEFDLNCGFSEYEIAKKRIALHLGQLKNKNKNSDLKFDFQVDKYGYLTKLKINKSKSDKIQFIACDIGNPSVDVTDLHNQIIDGLKTGVLGGKKIAYHNNELPLVGINWSNQSFIFDKNGNVIENHDLGTKEMFENIKLFTDHKFISDYCVTNRLSKVQFEASQIDLSHITHLPDDYIWSNLNTENGRPGYKLEIRYPDGRLSEVAQIHQFSELEMEQKELDDLITESAKTLRKEQNQSFEMEFSETLNVFKAIFKNEIHAIYYRDNDEVNTIFTSASDTKSLSKLKSEVEDYVQACIKVELERNII